MTPKNIGVGFILLTFLVFVLLSRWTDNFALALGLTPVIIAIAAYAMHKHSERKKLRELLNRFHSYYIVGMHPNTGEPPHLTRFAEYCIFVPHEDVPNTAKDIRDDLNRAKNPHNVAILEFSFMEPVDEMAVNEFFFIEEGENNYPARIMRAIEKDRAKVHVNQYKAGMKQYKKVVMGQSVEW